MAHFGTSDPKKNSPPRRANKGKLRLLFAGSLSQRKGLADLFGSFKLLKRSDVELVVLGAPKQPMDFYYSQYPDFVYESPRSHKEVIQLMQSCDALALPSLVEGCALVQQEAMSCGLPIIITPNTGGNHLIEDGKQGFIVPIRAPEKIAEKIDWFAEHRDETVQMGEEARRKANHIHKRSDPRRRQQPEDQQRDHHFDQREAVFGGTP